MTRPTHEKIAATAAVYRALVDELHLDPEPVALVQSTEPITKEQLKQAQLKLIPSGPMEVRWRIDPVVMAALIEASSRIALATDTRDLGILMQPTPKRDPGDHFAYPEDPVVKPERINDAIEWLRTTPDTPLPTSWLENSE